MADNHQNLAEPSGTGLDPPLVPFLRPVGESPPQYLSSARSYVDLKYLFGSQDIQDANMHQAKSESRNRRKPAPGDHVKHRRTRSGCYTCRSRRVKCDENHPTCERCRKGGRECVYPESTASSSSSSKRGSVSSSKSGLATSHESPGSSNDCSGDEDVGRLDPIADEDESAEATGQPQDFPRRTYQYTANGSSNDVRSYTRHESETPSLVYDKGYSPSPSSEGSVGYSAQYLDNSSSGRRGLDQRLDLSHLPQDLQFYLTFFFENLTYCHYNLKSDPSDFVRTYLLEAALRNETLLYALVGFSAFQYSVRRQQGKMQDFLQYYNKAVSLLLRSLRRGDVHNIDTLLAILQLATIEEYLGDWPNLFGHQRAAYEILTQLYTPQTIMQTEITRVVLGWYIRFDVFASMLGGFETVLSREWFSTMVEYNAQNVQREPWSLTWKIEHAVAQLRLIGSDISRILARKGKGEISHEQFLAENYMLSTRIVEWKTHMDPALQDSRFLVCDFEGAKAHPEDIVDPYQPGVISRGPLWVMNLAINDWYSIDMMHRLQTSMAMQVPPDAEQLGRLAYATCQLYEAVEFWPESPNGTVVALQASLGIACLFLPRDERHAMWARRKLATIESNGYIYPQTFRSKMADLFRDRSCMEWWLPQGQHYPPMIQSIRRFVDERTSVPRSEDTEDLSNMKAVFSSLNLTEDGTEASPSSSKGKEKPPGVAIAPLDAPQGFFFNGDEVYWDDRQDRYV